MFDSGITAETIITEIQSEADIAPDIPTESYVRWLNSVEQLLYSEVIKEQKQSKIDLTPALVDLAETTPGLKLNIWPLFDSQQVPGVELEVTEDGKYTIYVDVEKNRGLGATFTKKIILRAGRYILSDNATYFYAGGVLHESKKRIQVLDASTGTELASLLYQEPTDWETSLDISKDTEVILSINIVGGIEYPESGYVFYPQLEPRAAQAYEFIPPVSSALTGNVPALVCSLPTINAEAPTLFEDIYAVYADGKQLIKSTLASGVIFPDSYFKTENKLGLHLTKVPNSNKITLIYHVRPKLKTTQSIHTDTVKLPAEFIDLVKAKLRGEAYKVANEDGLAAKWINDYNVLVDTFKAWISDKQSEFGL